MESEYLLFSISQTRDFFFLISIYIAGLFYNNFLNQRDTLGNKTLGRVPVGKMGLVLWKWSSKVK